jgi:WD40 repeat protein
MKTKLFSILVVLLAMFTVVVNTLAQNYTTLGLPEGAKARLGKGKINEIKYSPDGTRLAVASSIGIWIYDAQTGEELELIRGHTSGVNSVSFSPDGSTWDANTGGPLRVV